MSEKKLKTYTAEFKQSAVKLAVESDQPISVTAKDLGVHAIHPMVIWHRSNMNKSLLRLRKKVSGKARQRNPSGFLLFNNFSLKQY